MKAEWNWKARLIWLILTALGAVALGIGIGDTALRFMDVWPGVLGLTLCTVVVALFPVQVPDYFFHCTLGRVMLIQ